VQIVLSHVLNPSWSSDPTSVLQVGHGLRRHGEICLIDVAPSPPFAGLERRDDGVADLMEMSRGVAVRRAVTTADVATRQAQAQMDPRGADFQAFFAPESPGRTWFEIDHVFTSHDHVCTLTRVLCSGPGDP
jgi:hypothetical protein